MSTGDSLPLSHSHLNLYLAKYKLDLTPTKIFQACTICYVVKNDPESKVLKIPAMGVFHLVEVGMEENGAILKRFDVYLDPGEVFARIAEVSKGK